MNSLRVPVSFKLLSSHVQLAHERSVLEFKSWTRSSQVIISLDLRLPNHLGDNPARPPTAEPSSAFYSCAKVHDASTNRNLFGCTNTFKHKGSTTKRSRVPRLRFHLPILESERIRINQSKCRFVITFSSLHWCGYCKQLVRRGTIVYPQDAPQPIHSEDNPRYPYLHVQSASLKFTSQYKR